MAEKLRSSIRAKSPHSPMAPVDNGEPSRYLWIAEPSELWTRVDMRVEGARVL